MRVLFAITKGEVGGAQRHLEIIAEGLIAEGHDVGAIVEQPSSLARSLEAMGASVTPWPSIERNPHLRKDRLARQELREAVTAFEPDVLHIHSAKAGVLGRGILKPPHGVTIFTCHHASFGPGRKASHRLVGRPIEQLSLRQVDGIISVGTRDMPLLNKLAPRVPIHLVRNAVPAPAKPHGPVEPTRSALWVARMQHPKDPLMAIQAWTDVVAAYPDAMLRLCGIGPLSQKVQHAAAASPVANNIEYLGFVEDLNLVYQQSSIYLLTTHVEGGTTMATLEAMSNGLVPVVTDAGDANMLTTFDAGVMTATSVAAVSHAIIDLMAHPSRLKELQTNALTYARERYTPTTMVNGTIRAYRDVLERSGLTETVSI